LNTASEESFGTTGYLNGSAPGVELFYWFFPFSSTSSNSDPKTQSSDSTIPLVIWLQGGPGASSMFGLFVENGPLKIVHNATSKHYDTVENTFSWGKSAHLLYIDNPAGTGFSRGRPVSDVSNSTSTALIQLESYLTLGNCPG
jgi:carboxypeptidase C (cathepsin A)